MIVVIMMVYVSKVAPDSIYEFFRTVADDDSGISKLNSLLGEVWHQIEGTLARESTVIGEGSLEFKY